MNTRTWLIIGVIVFYFWWSKQAQAAAASPGAAGTPAGTLPVSSVAVIPTQAAQSVSAIVGTIQTTLAGAINTVAPITGPSTPVGPGTDSPTVQILARPIIVQGLT